MSVDSLSSMADNLSVIDVIGGNGAARFAIRYRGAALGRLYDSADCRGRYLDEVLPPDASPNALPPYYRAVECGSPVYTIHYATDRKGRPVHFERKLLPFAHDGQTVDRILASFELFCPDGTFEPAAL